MSATAVVDEQSVHASAEPRTRDEAVAPLVTFAVGEVVAFVLWPLLSRHRWFFLDDWDFLAARKAGDVGDLFRPHNEHWSTIPILVWRAIFSVFGLHSYLPYQLVVVALHCGAAALLLVIMRRAEVRPWIATAAALLFLFFGSGESNIVSAFQIGFTGSLVFGLTQLLLADHDGPIDRRDWFGLMAGLAGLMTSGVGVTMAVVVGVAVLLRRGWRLALFHTVPLAAAYIVWYVAIGHEGYGSGQSSRKLFQYVWTGLRATYRAMGWLPGVGLALAIVLVVGVALAYADGPRTRARARFAVPAGLLVGSIVFLGIAAVGRSAVLGVASARVDRYLYLVAAMTIPALAIGADALVRRYRFLFPIVLALFLVGIPGNIRSLDHVEGNTAGFYGSYKHMMLSLAHDPAASGAPRQIFPEPANAPWMTIGWLVDNTRAGRVPAPSYVSAKDIVADNFRLSFLQSAPDASAATPCTTPLALPTTVDLKQGDLITLNEGPTVFPGSSDSMLVKPAGRYFPGPALRFTPSQGTEILVVRDAGATALSAGSRFFAPRVCLRAR